MLPKLIFKDLNLRLILLSDYSELNSSINLRLPQTHSFSFKTKTWNYRSRRMEEVMSWPHIMWKLALTRTRAHVGKSLSLQRWRTVCSQSQLTVYVSPFSHTDESDREGFRAAGFVVSVLPQAIIFNSTNSVRNSRWCSSLHTDFKSIHPPNR